jgi:hypothetical protein
MKPVIATLLLALATAALEMQAEVQTFRLAPQWNLIAFQIVPDDPSPEAVFGTLPGFQAAWTYDASRGIWERFVAANIDPGQTANETVANQILTFPRIEPGRAYWVYTSQNVPSWQVSGTVPRGDDLPALELHAGWNLVGIPIGAASVDTTEPVSLLAVLTAAGFDYDAMLTWENQSYRKMFRPPPAGPDDPPNPLEGLPPDAPFPAFNLQNDLGRGYWIRVTDEAVLRPQLVTTVRPDIDVEPFDNFPSKEDINVSGSLTPTAPRSVDEQDVIRFFPGEDVQTLGVANAGGGLMIWEAVWTPTTSTATPEPWIRLFSAPGEREQRDHEGNLLSWHTNLTGVTTLESDMIYLRLDRKSLGRGAHEGRLLLRTSVGDRNYRVIAEVPGLEGDFKGYAVIHSVNGRRNPVPDVDLHVTLYEDQRTDGLLRGLIDSSQALMWPVDVPLVGHRVADAGNEFVLGGSFVLPPGDQNGEPFDRWDENDPSAGADVDWLNDGVMDVRNPFPFPVQRTVSLEGALVHGNPTDGYVLQGSYSEIVYGMSRRPLVLLGTFHLERTAIRPLATRRVTESDTGVEPVVTKKNPVPLIVPVGATRNSAVSVETEMELQSVQVNVVFNAPVPHSALRISLQAPSDPPVELVLYDGRNPANGIHPRLLESLTFPIDRPTQGDFHQFLRQVFTTRTDPSRSLFWRLIVENQGSQSVTLANWSLRLDGQPITDVHGVVKSGDNPLAGVRVALDGVPFSLYSTLTDAQGRFVLHRVPLLPLNFSGIRPGYGPADAENPGLSGQFTRPFVGQTGLVFSPLEQRLMERFNPLAGAPMAAAGVPGFSHGTEESPFELELRPESIGQPIIAAGPLVTQPGTVIEFSAVDPAATVRWEFGDGTTSTSDFATHSYSVAGLYRVRLFSPANSATPQDTVEVIVQAAPGHAPTRPADLRGEPTGLTAGTAGAAYTAYAFQPMLIGTGVVPATMVGFDPATGADHYLPALTPQTTFALGETNGLGAAYVAAMPLQMSYTASMDIDLAPRVTPVNRSRPFDSDGFVALSSPGFDPSINVNSMGFRNEDFDYAHLAVLWQNTRAADGQAEFPQDAQNGLIIWGNTLITPHQNYSIQTFEARDGADFTLANEDDTFHPHVGTTLLPDLATHTAVTHYRMACSLGATILTAPTPGASVQGAKLRRSQPSNPLEPVLLAAPGPVSRNLYYQLHTGALAAQ